MLSIRYNSRAIWQKLNLLQINITGINDPTEKDD